MALIPIEDYLITYMKKERETIGTHDDEVGSSRPKHSRQYEIVEEALLPQVHYEFLQWESCNRDATSRYNTRLAQLLPRHIYSPYVVNWDILNRMGCVGEIDDMLRIRLREAGSNEEIFTFVAWIRAFNIHEPIYAKLYHEFYSTYEFDEVCADDELQTKKLIKFILVEPSFEGNPQDDHLRFVSEDDWFISKIARKSRVLTDDVIRSLSALIYYRDLDTTTIRELINSAGRLIPEDPQPGVPSVGIPRPPGASMQDLYQEVFEHMDEVYSVPLQGAYNLPAYAQPQYHQYYQ
ncbi:hypothetical protein Tco_1364144 [Tanacetum coccineum]